MYYDYTFECITTMKKVVTTALSQSKAEMEAKFVLKCDKVKFVSKRPNLVKTSKGF